MPTTTAGFTFDNTYADQLDGFYLPASPAGFPDPQLLELNEPLARELGLQPEQLAGQAGAAILSGNELPNGATPLAQVYAGHQFGGFSPQLGDGRALLLGEVIDRHGRRRDLQLKGSGQTPFSRRGDGRATLTSVLREYLLGEAMHALGIPTTRALAAVTTGDSIARQGMVPAAVLTRVAASHIRVGTFEFFAARGQHDKVRTLADYALARHYPQRAKAEHPYLELLLAVAQAQAQLVAKWMQVGFVHGVMNTDNVTISGETIDYGPCAFMDTYDPGTVFSSIDSRGRYAYGNQPQIATWNIARFAEALLPLLDPDTDVAVSRAHEALESFAKHYDRAWLEGMRSKLGLDRAEPDDLELVNDLLSVAAAHELDYTSMFRNLAQVARGDADAHDTFGAHDDVDAWMTRWRARLDLEAQDHAALADGMDQINPIYVPRNHKTEEALAAASERQDMGPFDRLLAAVSSPFVRQPELADLEGPAPAQFYPYQTFCGT